MKNSLFAMTALISGMYCFSASAACDPDVIIAGQPASSWSSQYTNLGRLCEIKVVCAPGGPLDPEGEKFWSFSIVMYQSGEDRDNRTGSYSGAGGHTGQQGTFIPLRGASVSPDIMKYRPDMTELYSEKGAACGGDDYEFELGGRVAERNSARRGSQYYSVPAGGSYRLVFF